MTIDFIGIGAQKSATSWIYANLYEHPEICAPVKEIHFFSRPRFDKGRDWYERHFKTCDSTKKKGEFSTSYLYSDVAAKRIHDLYPDTKIIAVLREPIARALSQYNNAIKAGEIAGSMTFEQYVEAEKSALEQGLYAHQLKRFYDLFQEDQILILIMEDIAKDPKAFMKRIYTFLHIDPNFSSTMLDRQINVARRPRQIWIEKCMHSAAETLRKVGLDALVHKVRQRGIPDVIRGLNTRKTESTGPEYNRAKLISYFNADVQTLSAMLGRDLNTEWNIQ